MAGDWIKMRRELQSHPKVVRILSATASDKFRAIGGLHAVWGVFDAHSKDGSLYGYTPSLMDHIIGWEGFSDALIAVGWLVWDGSETLSLPEFDEHNSQSAKRRAEDQKRKRNTRNCPENVQSECGQFADKKRTREEKRREDISKPPVYPKGVDVVFETLWKAYPRKVGKGAAEKAWAKLAIKPSDAVVLAAISAQRRSEQWQKDNGQFIPHPSTWISRRGWEDDIDLPQDEIRPSTECVCCGAEGSKKIGNAWYCFQHDQHSAMEAAYD